jgi:hypothetical protein
VVHAEKCQNLPNLPKLWTGQKSSKSPRGYAKKIYRHATHVCLN